MTKKQLFFGILFIFYVSSAEACRYTIREIGFSTLSKVTYVIYKIDQNSSQFTQQQVHAFSESNIKTYGFNLSEHSSHPIVKYVQENNLSLPAYVLMDPDDRMIRLSTNGAFNSLTDEILNSPIQKQLMAELPTIYATVLLIEGSILYENQMAKEQIIKNCEQLVNVMPNMPKQVEKGPNFKVISSENFDAEKVLLWSLGIDKIPEHPIVFVLYGKGRIMGESIGFQGIKGGDVFKHLSIIGADCECGLDRKWMLGYQVPLNWPNTLRQGLSDRLGFDVDNPMVLAEMSRILAIENKSPKNPDGVSFEPIVIDLDEEFDDIPTIEHKNITKEDGIDSGEMMLYTFLILFGVLGIGAFLILKKKNN